jgi:hypothetical protein
MVKKGLYNFVGGFGLALLANVLWITFLTLLTATSADKPVGEKYPFIGMLLIFLAAKVLDLGFNTKILDKWNGIAGLLGYLIFWGFLWIYFPLAVISPLTYLISSLIVWVLLMVSRTNESSVALPKNKNN